MRPGRVIDLLFVLAAFVGSSLIFVVQPMIARQLLPTLGGAPAVWTTCMLFFQMCLLAGYAWAHFGTRWLGQRLHALFHAVALGASAFFLPLGIRAGWHPGVSAGPAIDVLRVLVVSIGLPMCVLSATSPLIQRWHVALRPAAGERAYRLYAIGNVASLLVLLAYPLLIEPTSTLRQQRVCWSWVFAAETILLAICAIAAARVHAAVPDASQRPVAGNSSWSRCGWWVVLSAVPSSYLLGVTSYLTSDVAAVPFLWVMPLALYLGAFSLAFAGRRPADVIRHGLAPGLALLCLVLVGTASTVMSIPLSIAIHVGTFFLLAFGCLSELYARRPPAGRGLTAYYLWIAVGGVIGGSFNSLVAPRVFSTTLEYPIALLLCAALAILWHDRTADGSTKPQRSTGFVRGAVLLVLICGTVYAIRETRDRFSLSPNVVMGILGMPMVLCFVSRRRPIAFGLSAGVLSGVLVALGFSGQGAAEIHRSFFGVHRVVFKPDDGVVELYHGTILHGKQTYDFATQRPTGDEVPLTYYDRRGPLGDVFRTLGPTGVGVVGLGAGSIAAYLGGGQQLTYFEIDPTVIALADRADLFTYLRGARERGVSVDIVEGDARLTLARPADEHAPFDLLVLDAFSGDAIPAHLLTREAFDVYASRISDRGALAVHISNRYLDLRRVVAAGGAAVSARALVHDDPGTPASGSTRGRTPSTWMLLTRDPTRFAELRAAGWATIDAGAAGRAWTDDHVNLIEVLK